MEQLFCCGTVQGWRGVLLETRRRGGGGGGRPGVIIVPCWVSVLHHSHPAFPWQQQDGARRAAVGQGRTPRPGRDPAGGHQALGTHCIDPTDHGRSSSCPFRALPWSVPCTTEGILQPLSPLGMPGGSGVPRGDISVPLPGPSSVPQLSHHITSSRAGPGVLPAHPIPAGGSGLSPAPGVCSWCRAAHPHHATGPAGLPQQPPLLPAQQLGLG